MIGSSTVLHVCLFLLSASSSFRAANGRGSKAKDLIDAPLLTSKLEANPSRTIIVSSSGKDNFTSVQAAIDAVPTGNSKWIVVHLRAGVYREKVLIPENKRYIFLRGKGKGKTAIVWDDGKKNNAESATFVVKADNFVAFGISFKTCEIFVLPDRRTAILGSITAQNRRSAVDSTGFVFINCKVYGVGEVFLGRAKSPHSRVVFAKSYLSKTVAPKGWANWIYDGSTDNMLQGEHSCHGPGADRTDRVKWSRQLTEDEVAPFLTVDFINGKEWLPAYYE
ncbi:hypothetical protein HPP92_001725 [Vanilla planifolia]|uniref:pectinesterase n=1 Tax=Vanilla planifolia TaxID=51239 RepID=A0A835VLT8_VANPL|nr:hypothetical protein HPP92_001725 [Vanilla planifolia]